MFEVFSAELAQFLRPESMVKQSGQNRSVAHAFQGFLGRRDKQSAGPVIGHRRGFAYLALHLRTLYPFDRIVRDSISFAEILKERRGQPVPDRRADQAPVAQPVTQSVAARR
jgi:hypothetical protein